MSIVKSVKAGLIGGAALGLLSACASRSDVESLQNRVAHSREPIRHRTEPGERRGSQSQRARGGRRSVHIELRSRQDKG